MQTVMIVVDVCARAAGEKSSPSTNNEKRQRRDDRMREGTAYYNLVHNPMTF
jgi:hypothetical protein